MKQRLYIPLAIVLGGFLIAGGIFAGRVGDESSSQRGGVASGAPQRSAGAFVRGNPDAPITIVEFSDFECPFCAQLHPTLERIVEESGGRVSWEYRHFPLPNHRNAEAAARAGECIGRLAGTEAFWSYADAAFLNQRSLGTSFYEAQADRHGITPEELSTCMADGATAQVIRGDYEDAVAHGGRGTPFSIVVFDDGRIRPFSGALPYEQILGIIE